MRLIQLRYAGNNHMFPKTQGKCLLKQRLKDMKNAKHTFSTEGTQLKYENREKI